MATSALSPSLLTLLPTELLRHISDHLSINELKCLRLVCKAFEEFTSPKLFRTFVLYPHFARTGELGSLAKATHLTPYVQKIIFDFASFVLLEDALWEIDTDEVLDRPLTPEYREIIRLICSQSISCIRPTDQLNLMLALQQLLPSFENLYEIKVMEDSAWVESCDIPDFYKRYLGHEMLKAAEKAIGRTRQDFVLEEPSQSLMAIMLSTMTMAKPLRSLELHALEMDESMLNGDSLRMYPQFRQIVAALENLTLILSEDMLQIDSQTTYRLQILLMQATNLDRLTLKFGDLSMWHRKEIFLGDAADGGVTDERGIDHFMPTFHPVRSQAAGTDGRPQLLSLRLTWSDRIEYLSLNLLQCTDLEFREVLSHCSKSLRKLRVANFLLIPRKDSRHLGPRGCLVKLIKWMQKALNLQEVSFTGLLTNLGMQHWHVAVEPKLRSAKPSDLQSRVSRFIVEGGSCPLDHVEIPSGYYDLGKQQFDSEISKDWDIAAHAGDDSWDTSYPGEDEDWIDESDEGSMEEGTDLDEGEQLESIDGSDDDEEDDEDMDDEYAPY